ncbi:MAG: CRTAC1 family protein [Acidobacteriota bacterium]|nr:CRTAC1 family protein [Acidobacteriota bacterium]
MFRIHPDRGLVAAGLLVGLVSVGGVGVSGQQPPESIPIPPILLDESWVDARRATQLATTGEFDVFHDFRFTDQVGDSGITFEHRIVADAGKTYKAVHYDHGNGVAVADVDGDGLDDLYFVTQVGANGLWRNLGDGQFEDVTERARVGVAGRIGVTASFADIDNDGDPDLYVTTVRGGNVLFENTGDGTYRDISATSGLGYVGHSSGAVFFDYNRDGRLDLFLTNVGQYTTDEIGGDGYQYYVGIDPDAFQGHLNPERTEQSILFRNEGDNRFVDVSAEAGLQDGRWSGDASPIDVNEDGWIDLYVLSMQGDDEYYENVGGTRFVARGRELFPRTSWGAMGIQVLDFNNDGRLDIYITDMHSDMSQEVGPTEEKRKAIMIWDFVGDGSTSLWGNAFFLNLGSGQFREVSDEIGAENYWPWGPSAGDLNADGYEDVFVASSMNFPFRYGVNSVLLNNAGERFLDAEFILGVEPRDGGLTIPWFELGAEDRLPGFTGTPRDVIIRAARGSRSAVIFDLDDDGDLDIVTNEFNAAPMVLVSNLAEQTGVRYLKIQLTGTTSNRSGFGAIVRVTAGGRTYTQLNDGKSGYLSQSSYPLYFGLGAADAVESIAVEWPSGTEQTVSGPIAVNTRIEITEG